MTKTTKRTTYKCGKCGETGHNARTCSPVTASRVSEGDSTAIEGPPTVAMSETQNLTDIRKGPSGRPKDAPAPFSCPFCQSVAILVLIERPEGNKQLRCENCQHKTPVKTILKWGARPSDRPEGQPR